ncbi:hypothetical protein G7Z17_g11606 [Cylindrodendrum hubeiense]|uniref:Nucleoside phosphorylase domain-containing protein n=1 Tax=Cylindrodendrum hubeiense TaxID=595255 RepID=A0A9P5H4R8_9HYPO|nr:hypothetical protein G7Z17_g11606 [Cylindrodendrum hubeiense]
MATRATEFRPPRPTTRNSFEIAIICALTLEADAVNALFDVHWDDKGPPFDKAPGDPNAYSTGAIGRHNVVLAHMPGMGKSNAAIVASKCHMSFPNIKLALVVGICGAVPFVDSNTEIVLGDVVMSTGVIQYDFGRRLPEHFVPKNTLQDSLGRPSTEIRALLEKLGGIRDRKILGSELVRHLGDLQGVSELKATYPGIAHDRLFSSTYRHIRDGKTCEECECSGELVSRCRFDQGIPQPIVHFGLIASGDTVMKFGEERDTIARQLGVIGFEMESAAAACMKAFMSYWISSSPAVGVINESDGTSRCGVNYIPFPKNRAFVGRTDIIDTLKRMLFTEPINHQVALVGLGGMGKTQIALHLAHWTQETMYDSTSA